MNIKFDKIFIVSLFSFVMAFKVYSKDDVLGKMDMMAPSVLKSTLINLSRYNYEELCIKKDCVFVPLLPDSTEKVISFFGYKFGAQFLRKITLRHCGFYRNLHEIHGPYDANAHLLKPVVAQYYYSFKDRTPTSIFSGEKAIAIPTELSIQAYADLKSIVKEGSEFIEIYAQGREYVKCLGTPDDISDELKDKDQGEASYFMQNLGIRRHRYFFVERLYTSAPKNPVIMPDNKLQVVISYFGKNFCKYIKVDAYLKPVDQAEIFKDNPNKFYIFKINKFCEDLKEKKYDYIYAMIDSNREFKIFSPPSIENLRKKMRTKNPISPGKYTIIGVEYYSNLPYYDGKIEEKISSFFFIYQIFKDGQPILSDR